MPDLEWCSQYPSRLADTEQVVRRSPSTAPRRASLYLCACSPYFPCTRSALVEASVVSCYVHALYGFANASSRAGFEMVVVHTFDVDAASFCTTSGFTPFADNPMHLYMTTKQLRMALGTAAPIGDI